MADEKVQNVAPNVQDVAPNSELESNYLETIKQLKQNTVSKEAYDNAIAQNKQLLETIVNGGGNAAAETPQAEVVDIKALRNELFSNKDFTNLEFIDKSLQLRKAIMEQGGGDPFVGRGSKLTPTREDYEAAERTAKILQEMVDNAQGDNDVFLVEFNRRVNDVNMPFRR